ncbi:bifunctional diguanylate cyclase/phosphodiesterase [Azospirillum sp. TSH100]|uniref:putative bifunctional diguanylate cyclase/phosphodiesterase n=1 Tax=Azospirillum sp. TSH100 TaxID=652764 RepID=UPI002000321D|nr:EAL domain-containing protein [Azospirillum sp. TSH100]
MASSRSETSPSDSGPFHAGSAAAAPGDRFGSTPLRAGIATRVLASIVLFSSLVTLISTLVQLYFDFRREVDGIHARFRDIELSTVPSLGGSLWQFDSDQLTLVLDGIMRLPDVRMAEVREVVTGVRKPLVIKLGQPQVQSVLAAEMPLTRMTANGPQVIGILRVEATLTGVYSRLLGTAEVILVSQGIKTFLVSAFILFIFHRLVTRHLMAMADYMRRHDVRAAPPLLTLDRPKREHPDELDQLVRSFNDMSGDLYAANRELAGANEALERDMALRQAFEEQLYRQAHYDELTGLANRLLTRDRLEQAIVNSRRNKVPSALLFIDLDHFKNVNDTLGHEAGDALLREAAQRLKASIRQGDTLARMGGDEFLVILPCIASNGAAREVAERVVRAFSIPFTINGHDHFVTASIGIALYPTDGDDGPELLRNADLALYRAKEQGRSRYEFYTAAINERVQRRLTLENRLRGAVQRGEFVLHYQPVVATDTGAPVAFEALLRWRQPDGSLIAPGQFITVAEEIGLIGEIGDWVIETAVREAASILTVPGCTPRIAVNVSPRQLRVPSFKAKVTRALAASGLPPERLDLEITEGVIMDEAPEIANTLSALCGLGVRLSIDDFGTGYSSLSYLQRYPFDTLKIDRSFIVDAGSNEAAARLVETIILLARGLKLETIAEGVETEEQRQFLKANGCDLLQGYLVGRPVPIDEAAAFLRSRQWTDPEFAFTGA